MQALKRNGGGLRSVASSDLSVFVLRSCCSGGGGSGAFCITMLSAPHRHPHPTLNSQCRQAPRSVHLYLFKLCPSRCLTIEPFFLRPSVQPIKKLTDCPSEEFAPPPGLRHQNFSAFRSAAKIDSRESEKGKAKRRIAAGWFAFVCKAWKDFY